MFTNEERRKGRERKRKTKEWKVEERRRVRVEATTKSGNDVHTNAERIWGRERKGK